MAAGAEAVEDAVEQGAPVLGGLAALGAGLPVALGDRQDAGPEVVGDLPDGVQGLGRGTLAGHKGFLHKRGLPSCKRIAAQLPRPVLR